MNQEKNPTAVIEGIGLDALFNDAPKEVKEEKTVEEKKLPLDSLFDNSQDLFQKPQEQEPIQKKAAPKEEPKADTTLLNKVKEYIGEGFWEDVDVEVVNEDTGETELIPITDFKEITSEMFEGLKEQQKELKTNKFNDNYISVEGLDATTKKMIELKKAGGDLSELISIEQKHINPLNKLNLEDERVHEYLISEKLRSQGLDEDIIAFKINKLKKELTLDVEAKKVITEVNANFEQEVDRRKQEYQLEAEEAKKEQKEFKKSMLSNFRNLGIGSDSLIKNLVDRTAEFDEHGLTDVDKAFFEVKKSNPQLFAKVAYLLSDEKGFNDFVGVKIKNDVKKETVRSILKFKPKSSGQAEETVKKSTGGLDALFEK